MKRIVKLLLCIVYNTIGIIEWFLKRLLLRSFTFGKRKPLRRNPVAIIANGPTLMDELEKTGEEKGSVNYTENMQAIIFGVMSVLYNKPYEEFAGAVGNTEKK